MSRTTRRLAEPGSTVVYVLHADPGDVSPAATFERWPTATRTLQALRERGTTVHAVARTNAGSLHTLDGGVGWQFVSDRSRTGWRIAMATRRLRPAVVHVNGIGFAAALITLRLLCGRRVRLVVQHHGEPPGEGRSRLLQRVAGRFVDAYLFTGGEGQAEPFRAAGIIRVGATVHDVLESSTDLRPVDRDNARAATGVTGSPAVLWVGRLIAGKDPHSLLRAFAVTIRHCPDARLWLLYGDDRMEPELRAVVAADEALRDTVHFVGRVDHADIASWMTAADVIVSTSLREGSGYALIEALHCGCTPIVTDIAPHRTIVGPLGTQFAVGDDHALARTLCTVQHDRESVLRYAGDHLGWQRVADELIAAYYSSQ